MRSAPATLRPRVHRTRNYRTPSRAQTPDSLAQVTCGDAGGQNLIILHVLEMNP